MEMQSNATFDVLILYFVLNIYFREKKNQLN